MKILIVAHPDDEILWFNPNYFDLIIIVFLARNDKPEIKRHRLQAIKHHPEKDKIMLLSITESGYWKNQSRYYEHKIIKNMLMKTLVNLFNKYCPSEVYTHNHIGEYGHSDHILTHECVITVLQNYCPIWFPLKFLNNQPNPIYMEVEKKYIQMDLEKFYQIRKIYIQHKSWTWNYYYKPSSVECFYRII